MTFIVPSGKLAGQGFDVRQERGAVGRGADIAAGQDAPAGTGVDAQRRSGAAAADFADLQGSGPGESQRPIRRR